MDAAKRNKKYTYFIHKSWRMPVKMYVGILLAFLVVAFFMERYCFVLMVYKSKNYGGVLIMLIILFNALFLRVIKRLRQHKQQKRLHELYNIHQAPKIGMCESTFVG